MFKKLKKDYSFTWISQISEIPQTEWDTLAKPLTTPFFEWEWLNNAETSGSVRSRTGWQPCHLAVYREKKLVAAAPLYLKGHSYGEFVFDSQWADLAYRLGLEYYPKLLGMSPFTPAVGYRFLVAEGEDKAAITQLMLQEIDHFCDRNQISGCNFLFVDPDWRTQIEKHGYSTWQHHSYVWTNHNFSDFADYLKMFTSNQRKNIKRERKAVTKAGLEMKVFVGAEIPTHFYPEIYRFYSSTCDKFYWGSKYLTKKFFQQLYPNFSDRVVLFAAFTPEDETNPVGMSFCLHKGDKLYGRYWGCLEEYNALHFEACYYKPIEWAIANGIKTFDPGAGGSHKRRRGFPATVNYSLHRFRDRKMSQILRHYIGEINRMEAEEVEAINNDLPFNREQIEFDI